MSENKSYIPNRLKNASKEHPYVAGAVDIIDDRLNQNQQDVNAGFESAIAGFNDQNYITVEATDTDTSIESIMTREGITPQKDTVYRVGFWDGEQYDESKYSEYAYNEAAEKWKLLDVKEYTLATADDFIEPDAEKRAKVVPVGAAADVYGAYEENPEFVRVELDNEERIIRAIKNDGIEYLAVGVDIAGKAITTVVNNPEFCLVWLDNTGKILLGAQKDGNIFFGSGVPSQVINYIEQNFGKYDDIVTFLGDLVEGDDDLKDLLAKKVDGEYIDNPEFSAVMLDTQKRIVEGVKKNGTKIVGGSQEVGGNLSVKGSIKLGGENVIDSVESPEYMQVTTDSELNIISSRDRNGVKQEHLGFKTPNIEIGGSTINPTQDREDRVEVKTDSEGRILSYRDKMGVLHENVGIKTEIIDIGDRINLSSKAAEELKKDLGIKYSTDVSSINAKNILDSANAIISLRREAKSLSDEIDSLKLVRNGNTQDIITVNLRDNRKKKLILNLHKRASVSGAQTNDIFLPNANNDFSDVRVFANGKMLPYKVVNRGDYDIVPTEDFGHNCITKPWQNSDGNILYSGSVTGYKPGISTDDGHTWTVLDDIKDGFTGNVYISFLDKDDTMFIGDGPLLYRSPYPYTTKELVLDISDNGTYTGCHILSTDICQHPDGELFLGSYQLEKAIRIYKSVDGGVTWTKVHHTTDYQHIHHIMCDTHQTPAVIYAGCDDSNGLYYSKDKGTTWIDLNANGNLIRPIDYSVIYADTGFRLLGGETQHQGGHSIIRTTDDNSFSGVLSAGQACYMCQKLRDTLFAGLLSTLSHKGTEIVISKDSGLTWETAYSTMGVQQSTASDGFRIMQKLKEKNTDTEYIYVGCQDFGSLHQNDLKIYVDDAHFAEIIVDVPQGISSVRVESGYLISDNKEIYNDSEETDKILNFVPLNSKLIYDACSGVYHEGNYDLMPPIKKLGNFVEPIISGNPSLSLKSESLPLLSVPMDISECNAITISFWVKTSGTCIFDIMNNIRFYNSGFYFSPTGNYSPSEYLFSSEQNTLQTAKKFDLILDFANGKAMLYCNGSGYHYSDVIECEVNFGNYKNRKVWDMLRPVSISSDAVIAEFAIRNGVISATQAADEYFSNLDDNNN